MPQTCKPPAMGKADRFHWHVTNAAAGRCPLSSARYVKAVTGMKFWDTACKSDVYVIEGKKICIEAPGVNSGNAFKQVIGGHGVAIAEHRLFDEGMSKALWKDSLDAC